LGLDFFSGTGSDTRRSTCCDPTRTRSQAMRCVLQAGRTAPHPRHGKQGAGRGYNVDLLLAFWAFLGHATTEAEHQVEGRLLLDVVVGEGASVLELLAREDEALLVGGDALLVLDLRLDHVDGVRGLHLKSDGLARESLDEDLPPPPTQSDLDRGSRARHAPGVLGTEPRARQSPPRWARGTGCNVPGSAQEPTGRAAERGHALPRKVWRALRATRCRRPPQCDGRTCMMRALNFSKVGSGVQQTGRALLALISICFFFF
jgi:hypothetical protein